jgi:hypothetical protein
MWTETSGMRVPNRMTRRTNNLVQNRAPRRQSDPPAPHPTPAHPGAPFRDLLDHPKVSPVLDELYGGRGGGAPSFRIDHVNVHNWCRRRRAQCSVPSFPDGHSRWPDS